MTDSVQNKISTPLIPVPPGETFQNKEKCVKISPDIINTQNMTELPSLSGRLWRVIQNGFEWLIAKIIQFVKLIFGKPTVYCPETIQKFVESLRKQAVDLNQRVDFVMSEIKNNIRDDLPSKQICPLMDLQLLHFEINEMISMTGDLLCLGYKELREIRELMAPIDQKLQMKLNEEGLSIIELFGSLKLKLEKEGLKEKEVGFIRQYLSLSNFIKENFHPIVPVHLKGIPNIGNSCYLNSCLQAILCSSLNKYLSRPAADPSTKVEELRKALYDFAEQHTHQESNDLESKLGKATMLTAAYQIRKALFDSQPGGALTPGRLTRQQDAAECLLVLLEALGYHFSIKETQTALGDENIKSERNATNRSIEIPVVKTSTSFQEILTEWGREEIRDPENPWKREGKTITDYAREFKFTGTIPDVLVVQVKKFEYDRDKNDLRKVSTPLTWESDEVDLKDIVDPELIGPGISTKYTLQAYINHHGESVDWGHYTANIKTDSGEWYRMNDAYVSKVGPEEKKEREQAYLYVLSRKNG